MRRQHAAAAAALVALAAAILVTTAGFTAEQPDEKEHPVLDAAMRLDVSPLLNKLDRLEAELVLSRTILEQQAEKITAMQESIQKMQEAITTLKKPEKWEYHFLWTTSRTAANRLGDQGWELITAGSNFLVFRKPAPKEPELEP